MRVAFFLVPKAGIEPARVLPHRFLRPTRLPIPPLRLVGSRVKRGCKSTEIFLSRKQLQKFFSFLSCPLKENAYFCSLKKQTS